MSTYPEAYAKFRASSKAAVDFHDPNWTNSATTRERIRRLAAARAELAAHIPAAVTGPAGDSTARAAVLEPLHPTDANTVAVAQNEWAKVRALLDAGRNLAQLIQSADRRRLAAIIDRLPTDLAAQSTEPDAAIAEVEDLVIERLGTLGDARAIQYAEAERAADYESAWGRVLRETLRGETTVEGMSALYRVSPEEHEQVQAAGFDGFVEADIAHKVRQLDRIAATETEAADGRAE